MNFSLNQASHQLKEHFIHHGEALVVYMILLLFCHNLNDHQQVTAWGKNRETHVFLFLLGYHCVFVIFELWICRSTRVKTNYINILPFKNCFLDIHLLRQGLHMNKVLFEDEQGCI